MKQLAILLLLLLPHWATAQTISKYSFESSDKHPFGQVNPKAPKQTADFAHMIGLSECVSVNRNPDGTWQDTVKMEWKFKYILNGMGVQDETWKENRLYAGSIRQYNADSSQWYVSYYATGFVSNILPSWHGNSQEGKIMLIKKQKSPNGLDGYSRLTFYNISNDSFQWIGEWVDDQETIVYPFWKISCTKKIDDGL